MTYRLFLLGPVLWGGTGVFFIRYHPMFPVFFSGQNITMDIDPL